MKLMKLTSRRPSPVVVLAAVGLGWSVVAAALLGVAPASAGEQAPTPMLSISVDDGRTSAEVGDKLSYTISVQNIGTDPVSDLRVTQTMPAGLTLETADQGGVTHKGMVVWSVDLAAGRTRALHTTMAVGSTPDQVLRMASVACAAVSTKAAPLVCATHSDQLPAGATAAAAATAASKPGGNHGGSARTSTVAYAGAGGLIVLLAALGAVTWRRKNAREAG